MLVSEALKRLRQFLFTPALLRIHAAFRVPAQHRGLRAQHRDAQIHARSELFDLLAMFGLGGDQALQMVALRSPVANAIEYQIERRAKKDEADRKFLFIQQWVGCLAERVTPLLPYISLQLINAYPATWF